MLLIIFSIAVFFSPIACDEKPTFHENLPTLYLVNEGDSTQLECYANGSPKPKITWRRYVSYGDVTNTTLPNGQSTFSGSILKFPSITKEHRGRYLCIAENGVGEPIQELFNLQVRTAPKIAETSNEFIKENQIKLGCQAKGNPPPGVTWYKNDDILIDNDKHHVITGGWSDWNDSVDFFILLSKNNTDYKGMYKCLISNELGTDEHLFDVKNKV